MARKSQLRQQRTGTVINVTAKQQEAAIIRALKRVEKRVRKKFANRITLQHEKQWFLKDIVTELETSFPESEFHHHFDKTNIKPDGGILHIEGGSDSSFIYPILIAEVKHQGTNNLRKEEGLPKQAKGNAIERLGKNVIGLRAALMRESIFPFVCFGYGCDFEEDSSILDRVTTIAMFGKLNKTYLHNCENGKLNRGSFYFREDEWTIKEMADVMTDIAVRSVHYYFSKHGEGQFASDDN